MSTDPATAAQAISSRLARLANGLDVAADAMPGGAPGWNGPAAMAVGQLLATGPERFRNAASACRAAATTLGRYAEAIAPAVALSRASAQAAVEPAAALEHRAAAMLDEPARLAAGSLHALAGSAPARSSGWRNRLQRINSWRSELMLGAAESTEALAGTALKLVARVTNPFRQPSVKEFQAARRTVVQAVEHPQAVAKEIGKAALDWDTWRANPARAVGHLVPDAVAAVASGGTAAGVRATTAAEQSRAALRIAVARDSLRREATGSTATAARAALIHRAEAEARTRIRAAGPGAVQAWRGEGGAALTALQNAGVEAYHAMSTAREKTLTAIMKDLSEQARGELNGLENRLKTTESAKRKVATEHARTGGPLPTLLAKEQDAVRYSVVLTEENYVRGLTYIASDLERLGFYPTRPHNAWHGPRYRGVNTVWVDPQTGASFEVQFHTPASYLITKRTHRMYEEFRLPTTAQERKAQLNRLIAAEYRKAPIPGWVTALRADHFPPPAAPAPIPLTADRTVSAAGLGAGTTHVAATEPRPPPPPHAGHAGAASR